MEKYKVFVCLLFLAASFEARAEICEEKAGFDQIISRCEVVDNGQSDPKSAIAVHKAKFCIRKRTINFASGPEIGYWVEGEIDGQYIGKKRSNDGLFPGPKGGGLEPGAPIHESPIDLHASTRLDGGKISDGGMTGELREGMLRLSVFRRDGVDKYTHWYRLSALYDFSAQKLNFAYERDYGLISIIPVLKPLVSIQLSCRLNFTQEIP